MPAEFHACPESGVPPGRGRSTYAIQAINCLATIVKSLRDKKPTQFLRASAKLALMGFSPWAMVSPLRGKTSRPRLSPELLELLNSLNSFFLRLPLYATAQIQI